MLPYRCSKYFISPTPPLAWWPISKLLSFLSWSGASGLLFACWPLLPSFPNLSLSVSCLVLNRFPAFPLVALRAFKLTNWFLSAFIPSIYVGWFKFSSLVVVTSSMSDVLHTLNALPPTSSYTSMITTPSRRYTAWNGNRSLLKYYNNNASGILLNQKSIGRSQLERWILLRYNSYWGLN